jgi:hypothetical protein
MRVRPSCFDKLSMRASFRACRGMRPDSEIPIVRTGFLELSLTKPAKRDSLAAGSRWHLRCKKEARYVQEMARRIAATLLLGPALDANYQAVVADTYAWPRG